MRLQSVWERLHEVKGMHFEELIEWLKINSNQLIQRISVVIPINSRLQQTESIFRSDLENNKVSL